MQQIESFTFYSGLLMPIWDALRDLVSFVQFKKRENTYEGVLFFNKVPATLLKVPFLNVYFSRFSNFTMVPNLYRNHCLTHFSQVLHFI